MCLGPEIAAALGAAGVGAEAAAPAMGALGTASLFGPSSAGLSSLASSALTGSGMFAAANPGIVGSLGAFGMETAAPGALGLFGLPSASAAADMGISPLANQMAAGATAGGLPWQKLAKLGGAAMLGQGQQQPQMPAAGPAPSASGPQGAPASLFTMPQIGAGTPLGGAQAMQARLQGLDPMMMLRMQQRGY